MTFVEVQSEVMGKIVVAKCDVTAKIHTKGEQFLWISVIGVRVLHLLIATDHPDPNPISADLVHFLNDGLDREFVLAGRNTVETCTQDVVELIAGLPVKDVGDSKI
jgi:hypothetical protein